MAIFKIMLTSAMLFAVAPLASTHFDVVASGPAAAGVSTPAAACETYRSECHGESTIYKNQSIPDFLLKQSEEIDDHMVFAPDYNASVVENRLYLEV